MSHGRNLFWIPPDRQEPSRNLMKEVGLIEAHSLPQSPNMINGLEINGAN